jgi:2'-5' RNA ligase
MQICVYRHGDFSCSDRGALPLHAILAMVCGILFQILCATYRCCVRLPLILRSFIAIELPEEVKSALSRLQDKLKESAVDIRWVKPDNIHLTLKFLGDIDDKNIGNIVQQLEGACAKYSFFELAVSGIGVFPNVRSPRVMWAGLKYEDAFAGFHGEIENGLASIGYEREGRRFSPHLTLGRFRSFKGKASVSERIELHKNDRLGSIGVRTISLMESKLSPSGASYSRVKEIALTGR